MTRHFNTTGPVDPAEHYAIDPFARIDWPEIDWLIRSKKYFVLHAPRQSGKTTLLNAMMHRLNEEGRYHALYVNVESASIARENVALGEQQIIMKIVDRARILFPSSWLTREGKKWAEQRPVGTALNGVLGEWTRNSERPTVLLIDEIDSLRNETLVSVLHQLRDGYNDRPDGFPHSVILCGVRDVREYRIQTAHGEVTGASCFNVKAKSLRIGNFTEADVRALYGQHTTDTGQVFEESIYARVMPLTGGQPWLVNALAHEVTHEMVEMRDRSKRVGLDEIDEAKERLIRRRDTHLDQLADKLSEPRVRSVIAPILGGDGFVQIADTEDVLYVIDLGLVARENGSIRIANDIYREVIPRELASKFESEVTSMVSRPAFILEDGRLDVRRLVERFQQFYRENSVAWTSQVLYPEAAPHILLQAWLMHLVNSGGQIVRESALGTKRADILVRHFHQVEGKRAEQRFVIELKVLRPKRSIATTITEGTQQVAEYADTCGAEQAHLIVVDQRAGRSWSKKVFVKEKRVGDRVVTVWGM